MINWEKSNSSNMIRSSVAEVSFYPATDGQGFSLSTCVVLGETELSVGEVASDAVRYLINHGR
jgi:hypothetical protein